MTGRAAARDNQKLRTQRAIVDAAREIIRRGEVPTVASAAELALVSTATAYRYFPDQLSLLRAGMGDDFGGPDPMAQPTDANSLDPRVRIEHATRELLSEAHRREALIRSVMALSLLESLEDGAPKHPNVRPGLRVAWIDHALESASEQLDPDTWRLLRLALAILVSSDALVTLQDVFGISADEAIEVCAWGAGTLVSAVLDGRPEADVAAPPAKPRSRRAVGRP